MIKISRLKTDELKKLAVDFHHGHIFTNRDIAQPNLFLHSVFMPLIFMKFSKKDAECVGLIYEYLDKAGPRSINGMPMFYELSLLGQGGPAPS